MEIALTGLCRRKRTMLRVAVPPAYTHPSHYAVRDLVAELTAQGAVPQPIPVSRRIGRVLAKGHIALPSPLRRRRGPVLVPLMGARFAELYGAALTGDVVPYCWDVWEPQWRKYVQRLRPLRPRVVFVTAAQSAQFLAGALPDSKVVHLPEATRMSWFTARRPLADRSIGVLELGRRFEVWHEAVREAVRVRGCHRHIYTSWSDQLVFPDERALRDGLSDTVVSVCFPSSITHPRRSGQVETMTHRYLESIASGCLVVGHAPSELVELIGYNPVVEVDWSAPADQLLDILAAPEKWQSHVDNALRRMREVGDWSERVRRIRETLEANGFGATLSGGTVRTAVGRAR
ncbi:glycosyltransferase [Streptomyces humicola]|uniref:glycosyltransferase n=1 Tax=Streptomyces humicola TaxID=2953240 RepID=UPI00210D745E|nr:glycosyltransferase [Streptomyces humicola]